MSTFSLNLLNKKSGIVLSLFAITALSGLLAYSGSLNYSGLSVSSSNNDNGIMYGHLTLMVLDQSGNTKNYVQTDNLIVDEGMDTMIDLLFPDTNLNGNSTDTEFSVVGIGTGNTAAAAGNIGEETLISGCSRIQDSAVTGSSAISGESTATVNVQFSGATCASTLVREAVLVNSLTGAANAGELLDRQVFAAINLGAIYTLDVSWAITVT